VYGRIHYKKKHAILRGFLRHFAGVFNLCRLFCGSFENCRLIGSHKLTAGVLGDPWYRDKNPRKIPAVLLRWLKTPAKLKNYFKK
jgi:hypothetical protein